MTIREGGKLDRGIQSLPSSKSLINNPLMCSHVFADSDSASHHAGLINAAPGKKTSGLHVASRQVETMVQQKMMQPEYIILCLEDNSDWSNATTRRLVMSVRAPSSRSCCTLVARAGKLTRTFC